MRLIEQSVEVLAITFPVTFNDFSGEYEQDFSKSPEQIIELAGRTCYKSEDRMTPDSNKAFIEMICKNNHASVLEHGVATMKFITDRGITHELVRHRIASFSQESTRYVNYTKGNHGKGDIQFVLPLDLNAEQRALFLEAYESDQNYYNRAIGMGCTPQQARDLLPTGLKTEIVMTANFREWKHVFDLRTAPAAHPKMRVLMFMAYDAMTKVSPTIFPSIVRFS